MWRLRATENKKERRVEEEEEEEGKLKRDHMLKGGKEKIEDEKR